VEAALDDHGAPRPEALHADMGLLASVDLRTMVTAVTQPALLIAGQNDRVVPPAATHWLAGAMPHARFHQIARSGHAPFISHVEEVAALLRPFLAGLPQAAGSAGSA
jgi:pimeloyl-[acyl-carrier protein] methyl ester esterase